MQTPTYLSVVLDAVLAWQTLSHFYVKRWRPTDFSVFLLTSFRCNCHTHGKIIRWTAWMDCGHENQIYQQENRVEERSFSSKVSLRLQPRRWRVGCFFLPPLRVQSLELTTANATVTVANNQTTCTSTENTNSRAQVSCPRCRAQGLKIDPTLSPTCIINM